MLDKSEEFDRAWAGPKELKPAVYRTQSEKDTFYAVAVENEYKCPPLVASDVVIDIGAHIGSFSYLARRLGSKNIYAFEIDPWHIEAALQNLKEGLQGTEPDIVLHHAAVVRGDEHRASEYHYNGAWNSFAAVGPKVDSISLDEILAPHESVRFLKTDCEGCEFPILYTCTQLHKVQEIAGEYHIVSPDGVPELENLPYPISLKSLMSFLYGHGFAVHVEEHGPTIGNFHAKRI